MMKIQKDKKPHRTFGDIFGRITMADFSSFHALKTSPLIGWVLFVFLCLSIAVLMTFSIGNIPANIVSGTIAQRDLKADRNYEIIDEEATGKFRTEALAGVLDVYDYDPELGRRSTEHLSAAFDRTREQLASGTGSGDELKAVWEKEAGVLLSPMQWRALLAENFSGKVENAVNSLIISAMARPIVPDKEELLAKKERGIILRSSGLGDEKILTAKEIANLPAPAEVKEKLRRRMQKDPSIVQELAGLFIQPNVSFGSEETNKRRDTAKENVKSVILKIDAGEIIIRGGARYEPRHVIILEGIRKEKEKASAPLEAAGIILLIILVILSTYYFAERYIKKFAPRKTDLYFIGSVLILILAILKLSLGIGSALHDSIGIDIPRAAFNYAIPVAGAAMLIRFILNSETALIFSVVLSIFAGIFVENDLNYTAFCLISSVAAASSIAYADKRSSIMRAGIYTSVINIFAAIGIHLVNAGSITESLGLMNFVWYILFAILGGMSCSIFVMVITPVAEMFFGYTTDIKLLELANLNHPLLRELVIRAPGTYHHSHLVGILAESAAEAIGANPLLARVAAYYHDIGKIRKPLYFTENMRETESRYDKLSPHMSALIISSHVKDGIELAREYKVPERIVDMIPQHHGTKMISFFYEKAKELADPALEKLDEKDFRYPGPKPQTREAGILLLADAVEAAVRALKEKSPARVQQTVEDMINKSFTEAQLDECDLTLRNLYTIAKAFTKILMGIYHQRIEYPKEALEQGT